MGRNPGRSSSRPSAGRRAAHEALGEARRRDARIRDLLRSSKSLEELSAADGALAFRLAMGVTGARGHLDNVLDAHITGRAHLEPRVRDALRLSCYELLFLATPVSVAVNEGVELVRLVRPRAAGLANAVLRKVAGEDVPRRREALALVDDRRGDAESLALVSGYPKWMLRRVCDERGLRSATDFARCALDAPPVYVMGNLARHTDVEVRRLLLEAGLDPRETSVAGCYVLGSPAGLARSGLVQDVDVAVADLAAMEVVSYAAPVSGERILEIGQGRGTKSLLLESMALRDGDVVHIVAIDSEGFKVRVASERMRRAGLSEYVSCLHMDAREVNDAVPLAGQSFDLVFVDAPCSGSGTLARHPEIAWDLSPSDVDKLSALQLQILQAAAGRVRVGGRLCYATCSVFESENQSVVSRFLASDAGRGFVPAKELLALDATPASHDGHSCACLMRHS